MYEYSIYILQNVNLLHKYIQVRPKWQSITFRRAGIAPKDDGR